MRKEVKEKTTKKEWHKVNRTKAWGLKGFKNKKGGSRDKKSGNSDS